MEIILHTILEYLTELAVIVILAFIGWLARKFGKSIDFKDSSNDMERLFNEATKTIVARWESTLLNESFTNETKSKMIHDASNFVIKHAPKNLKKLGLTTEYLDEKIEGLLHDHISKFGLKFTETNSKPSKNKKKKQTKK